MHRKIKLIINFFLALTMVLSVACRGTGVTKVSEFSAYDQPLPRSITLVSWNAQKGAHPQFTSDLTQLLALEQPDIVFLQEASSDLARVKQMGGVFRQRLALSLARRNDGGGADSVPSATGVG